MSNFCLYAFIVLGIVAICVVAFQIFAYFSLHSARALGPYRVKIHGRQPVEFWLLKFYPGIEAVNVLQTMVGRFRGVLARPKDFELIKESRVRLPPLSLVTMASDGADYGSEIPDDVCIVFFPDHSLPQKAKVWNYGDTPLGIPSLMEVSSCVWVLVASDLLPSSYFNFQELNLVVKR